MRTVFAAIVAIVILGGGYYWYTSMNAAPATMQDDTSGADMNADANMNTETSNTGAMEDGTMPEDTGSGTSVDVGASAHITTGTTKSFTVTGSNFVFSPKTMTVKKGDTVKITFVNSGGTHDWNLDEFNAHSGIIQGGASKTVTFVADKAGSFEYYCAVGQHRQMGMKGTLTVTN